jgi:hypothetical protein
MNLYNFQNIIIILSILFLLSYLIFNNKENFENISSPTPFRSPYVMNNVPSPAPFPAPYKSKKSRNRSHTPYPGPSPGPYPGPISNQIDQAICNKNKPINFTYTNIGYSIDNNLFQYDMGPFTDINSATIIAQNNGATGFQKTLDNRLKIGFMYNNNKINNNRNSSSVYAVTLPLKILNVPTTHDYTIFSNYKDIELDDIFDTVFFPDPINPENPVNTVVKAKSLANSYGATAFFVDEDGEVYITFNFNPFKFTVTDTKKSYTNPKNQLYYVKCFFN